MRRILVAALILLPWAFPSPGRGLQLSALLTNCRVALRDTATDTNFQRFSDAQLTSFLNDGQNQLNNAVEPLLGTYSFDTTAAVSEYSLPSDFKAVYRLTLAGKRLAATGHNALDANFTNWTTATSTPTLYYLDPYSSSVNAVKLGLYPTPKLTTTGSSASLFYFQNPAALAASTDVPFNGRSSLIPYHDALTHFCALRGWSVQNRPDLAKLYADIYGQDVAAMKNDINFMPDYSPSVNGYRGPPSQTQ